MPCTRLRVRAIDLLAHPGRNRQKEVMRRLILMLAVLCPPLIRAELPPSAYERMQAAATEFVEIEVLRVDVGPGDAPGRQDIHLLALVDKVTRAANVKENDLIKINYTVTGREKGWMGPGEIPVLEEKARTLAYLVKDQTTGEFHPAAGAMSFRNF
ncbi:MAG: hypothetical protein WC003_15790 [Terrimicrobiaceae bacterium]